MQFDLGLQTSFGIKHIRKKLLSLILVSTLASFSSTGFAAAGGGGPKFEDGQPNYFALEPPFVVNIHDRNATRMRFLQIGINLMTMQAEAVAAFEKHKAPIRHELIMLFGHKTLYEVMGRDAQEQLRQEALSKIQQVIEKYAYIPSGKTVGKKEDEKGYLSGVQDLYFTNFIIQ